MYILICDVDYETEMNKIYFKLDTGGFVVFNTVRFAAQSNQM